MSRLDDDLAIYERRCQRYEEKLPVCCFCHERIFTEHAYDLGGGDYACADCEGDVLLALRVSTSDLVED